MDHSEYNAMLGVLLLIVLYGGFLVVGRDDLGWRGILTYIAAWVGIVLCIVFEVFSVFIWIPAFFLLYCILVLHVMGYSPRVR